MEAEEEKMKYLKVFTDFQELMEPLDFEERGRLFTAMIAYAEDGRLAELSGNERFVWAMARRIIDREAEIYEEKVSSAERARGCKRKPAADTKVDPMVETMVGSKPERLEPDPLPLVSDKEYDHEEEKEEEHDKEHEQEYVCMTKENAPAEAGTHIPTREEIKAFCEERKNGIDGDYFFDYYAATGWRVGQNPIRDWRALVRAWEQRDKQQGQLPPQGTSPRPPTGQGRPGPLADAVQNVLDVAQAKHRARQRNTLLNYREEPSHVQLEDISFDLDEL